MRKDIFKDLSKQEKNRKIETLECIIECDEEDVRIDDFSLSYGEKLYLILKQLGVNTLEELLSLHIDNYSNKDIEIKNHFGKTIRVNFNELKRCLNQEGYFFDYQKQELIEAGVSSKLAMTYIGDLPLPTRLMCILSRNGYNYFYEIILTDCKRIFKIKQMGNLRMTELMECAHSLGIKLKNEQLVQSKIEQIESKTDEDELVSVTSDIEEIKSRITKKKELIKQLNEQYAIKANLLKEESALDKEIEYLYQQINDLSSEKDVKKYEK